MPWLYNFPSADHADAKISFSDADGTHRAYEHHGTSCQAMPSSTREKAFWQEHEDFLRIAQKTETFIKTVITNDTDAADVRQAAAITARVNANIPFILQPNYFEMKQGVVAKCEGLAKECAKTLKDVRILPQIHKFMKLR